MLTNTDINKLKKVFATKNDLKKSLRSIVRKKDLQAMERRLTKRINLVSDSLDSRVLRIEKHLNFSPVITA